VAIDNWHGIGEDDGGSQPHPSVGEHRAGEVEADDSAPTSNEAESDNTRSSSDLENGLVACW
jgi:hypothetical protein